MRYLLWVFVLSSAHAQIQINELMIDPNPVVQLPNVEYIELYNYSGDSVNLKDFAIADLTKKVLLIDTVIPPDKCVILTKASTQNSFATPIIGLSSWPSLNNSSDEIRLYKHDIVIDSIFYDATWNQLSNDGGISLERKSLDGYCSIQENWTSSIDKKGGTPGKRNSVFESTIIIPKNKITELILDDSVQLFFQSDLFKSTPLLYVNGEKINHIFNNQLKFNNQHWNGATVISIKNLANCKGTLFNLDTVIIFTEQPQIGDLLLTEILFNPIIGGEDYVEITNTTNTYLNLSEVKLSNYDEGILDEKEELNMNSIPPYGIMCFTKDKHHTLNQYPKANSKSIFELNDLPTFRNDSGTVVLINKDSILDKFTYREDMHHQLLDDTEGVSLERVNTNNAWHSSASSQNYGTPGYKNSQTTLHLSQETFSIEPKVFTPDFDGYKDFTTISYNLEKSGCVGNIGVYDLKGTKIKTLATNSLLDVEGEFVWDGTSDLGGRAKIGHYIVLFELDIPEGGLKKWKKTVALGTRFN